MLMGDEAMRWRIGGRVQGVGFRPFVYRLANACELVGWVRNDSGAVEIHVQGSAERLKIFGEDLFARSPSTARTRLIDQRPAPIEAGRTFRILPSTVSGCRELTVPFDSSMCDECATELADPAARRYRYPFTNCTQCGPRYTIIRALPYDRHNTTMAGFELCASCAAEFSNPRDRRFHAEPLACAACGPSVHWTEGAACVVQPEQALAAAVTALRAGRIVALRGIGGYHLLCDAMNDGSVVRLRQRKGRPDKPFAVMLPWDGREPHPALWVADLSPLEEASLCDAARSIVLVRPHRRNGLSARIAPGLTEIGIMLPYSPLHSLLLKEFGGPVVATSGNVSGEPVLTDPDEAQRRLAHVADGFLHHNRPIARPAEDAVSRRLAGVVRPIRLGRGTAPVELTLSASVEVPILAVGAYLKGCIALAWGRRVVVSPHLGDQATPRGKAVFLRVVEDLQALYGIKAERVAHDTHPQFPSTRWAKACGLPSTPVWHHHAHAAAVAGEYPGPQPMLCFTWDGMGLGVDHTLWGGEALLGRPGSWRRVASFRPFRLPGGERAAREPWRCALALCWHHGVAWPEGDHRAGTLMRHAFDRAINSPLTTSVGRLFDAAAALIGVCVTSSYEGEAPMRLEALCERAQPPIALPLLRDAQGLWRTDWSPLILEMLDGGQTPSYRAARFHASLAHALLGQALAVRGDTGVNRIGLTGGVFQNRILTEQAAALLGGAGFEVQIPERLPLNDAAISFGQIVEATALHAARH
jgi:hydrogenase maturation protein HypF